jgi:hypothetical protein
VPTEYSSARAHRGRGPPHLILWSIATGHGWYITVSDSFSAPDSISLCISARLQILEPTTKLSHNSNLKLITLCEILSAIMCGLPTCHCVFPSRNGRQITGLPAEPFREFPFPSRVNSVSQGREGYTATTHWMLTSSPDLTPGRTSPDLTPGRTSPDLTPGRTSPDLTPVPTSPFMTPVPTSPFMTPVPTSPEWTPQSPSEYFRSRYSQDFVAPAEVENWERVSSRENRFTPDSDR